jgi:uncharacterized Tic20 family protein
MKKALVLFVFGLLLILGSCAPYGIVAYRATHAHVVHEQAVAAGQSVTTGILKVDTQAYVQPALKLRIFTTTVVPDDRFDDGDLRAKYQFPVDYRLIADNGDILYEGHVVIDQSGARINSRDSISKDAARLRYEKGLEKVTVPASGRIRVMVHIHPDDVYQARLESARLVVYDRVYRHGPLIGLGIALGVIGVILALAGFIWWLSSISRNARSEAPIPTTPPAESPGAPPVEAGESSRRYAGLLHLSALLGLFVPLAGLVAQLAMWLAKRETDGFIDQHGMSAINFRLSMLIYSAVSVVLMFTVILIPLSVLALIALGILNIVFSIIAATRAFDGEPYCYPIAIRFLK